MTHSPSLNLLDGFDTFIHKDLDEAPNLDAMLSALAHHEKMNARLDELVSQIDMITWRGILTKLLVTPYLEESWHFKACMVNVMTAASDCERPQMHAHDPCLHFSACCRNASI